MSNVFAYGSFGSVDEDEFDIGELDGAPGVAVVYVNRKPGSKTELFNVNFTYCVYGTDGDDGPLVAVNHYRESPTGSGLYFNAYARNMGKGKPTTEYSEKSWRDSDGWSFTAKSNTLTSGHVEYNFPGVSGIFSCFVGPITFIYTVNYWYHPTMGVIGQTIYKGNLITVSSETRTPPPHVRAEDLESLLSKERLQVEYDIQKEISRTFKEGPYHNTTSFQLSVPRFNFKKNEYYFFECIRDLGLIPGQLRMIAGNAYINACQNLPKTANNTLQNVVEVIDLIKSIKSGNLIKAATSFTSSSAYEGAKSAWLAYRYQYNTTKMDFNEYKDLIIRLHDLQSMKKITIRGEFAWGGYQCRCSFDVNACDFIPHTLNEYLRAYGLYFKTADIWDDIPFSFIVDWFLHLGDAFTWLDTHEDAWNVRPSNVWYSWETSYEGQTCYIRAPGEPIVNAPYLQSNTGSSVKVKAMRFADVISIFL